MNNNEQSQDDKILIITFIATIIYILYLEINPKITGIWLRKDSNNNIVLALHNLKDFFAYPFKEYRMWIPNMWDMNPYISIPLLSSGIYFLKKLYNKKF